MKCTLSFRKVTFDNYAQNIFQTYIKKKNCIKWKDWILFGIDIDPIVSINQVAKRE